MVKVRRSNLIRPSWKLPVQFPARKSPHISSTRQQANSINRSGNGNGYGSEGIKENTLTFEQKVNDGFLLREEWRRDASNHPYFLTDTLGIIHSVGFAYDAAGFRRIFAVPGGGTNSRK
jgi:hypothetical protein